MPCLQTLDRLEDIENLTHRAVLQALRDTDFTMGEIAKRLKIHVVTAYHIVRQYLPQGYIRKRTQMLHLQRTQRAQESPCSPDDLVQVVPAKITASSNSALAQTPTYDDKCAVMGRTGVATTRIENNQNSLSLQHGGFVLKWEGVNDHQ
ncbi:MAG: hypothetical protein IK079_05000 [Desulfovibrio sp.]|nr:hypothetical protein [Desulfovibrio sp.]